MIDESNTQFTQFSHKTTKNTLSSKNIKDDQDSGKFNHSQKINLSKNLTIKSDLNKKNTLDYVEEDLLSLKNTITPNEFLNSIKSGFELALCIYNNL